MDFEEYQIIEIKNECEGVFVFRVKPKNPPSIFSFLPGQFAQIKNPKFEKPEDAHLFSIASSPNSKEHLEFCIKTYGPWTQEFSKLKTGDALNIKGPFGKFIYTENDRNCVFIAAGIGIVPFISMLRFIDEQKIRGNFILLYRNHANCSIAYKKELDNLSQKIQNLKIIPVLSNPENGDLNNNHQNLITSEFIKRQINLEEKPLFFLCGSPAFVEKTKEILKEISVEEERIKLELY